MPPRRDPIPRKTRKHLEIARRLERWFGQHQRRLPWRRRYLPYHVWVSEVMLQQTRMEVVLGYFSRFIKKFPTVRALARASEADVLAAWSGLGYYRRAKMLRAGAVTIVEHHGGRIPDDVATLRTIPGIGRYTAGAVASIAYGRRAAIVDGNVARVVSRLFGISHRLGSREFAEKSWRESEALVGVSRSARDFNQALMEHGARVCKPRNPLCIECVVAPFCVAAAKGQAESYPRPKKQKKSVSLAIPLYIVTDGRGKLLMRRQNGTLMNAMYHLPHGNSALLGDAAVDSFRAGDSLGSFRHTVTHRRIQFELVAATIEEKVADRGSYEWIDPADLGSLPHPAYVRKAVTILQNL